MSISQTVRSFALFSLAVLLSPSVLAQGGTAAANCEPRVETASVLNSVGVNGFLYIDKFYARCLPVPAKQARPRYHPYNGGKFSTTLKNSSGQTVNTFVWYGDLITTIWEFERYEIVGGREALKQLEPGNYTLEYAIEDKVFQRFPFSLSTRASSDQFKPGTIYVLDGQWSEFAQLYAPNVDRFFQLIVWLRNEKDLAEPKQAPVPVAMRLIREKDKQLVAESDEGLKLNLTPTWRSVNLSFRRPNRAATKDTSEFKLSEILAQEGRYRIELMLNGQPYREYKFNVKNGMINDIDLAQMRKELYRISVPLTTERPARK